MRWPAVTAAVLLAGAIAVAGCGTGSASTLASGETSTSTSPIATHDTHRPASPGGGGGGAGRPGGGGGGAGRPGDGGGGAGRSGDGGGGAGRPAGFWYGTDSWPVTLSATAPYTIPYTGGVYGGYIGMAGNWARWQGCATGNMLAWSAVNAQQADVNYSSHGKGIGTGVYWYMGGPGVDPGWNGTTTEARQWGEAQAAQAIAHADADRVTYKILFLDIELPGIKPALDNGWTSVYSSPCSGKATGARVTPELSRAEFNGFTDYLKARSGFLPAVYSEPQIWQEIFGTGSLAQIPHTYEWTYTPATADLRLAPRGWCLRGTSQCAQFFGGVTADSPYAVMWQWSGGGGIRNPYGDFDQINANPVP
jgi:hypothetical protein